MSKNLRMGAAVLGAAALICGPASAQVAHHFVAIATATLPEPGNPLAIMFVDTGSIKKTGDVAAFDLVYALGKPQKIDGADTSHVVFNYEVTCSTGSMKTTGLTAFASTGPGRPGNGVTPAHVAAAGSVDEAIVKRACGTAPPAGHAYASLDEVTRHAQSFMRSQREMDRTAPHSIVYLGAGNSQVMGNFVVFVDLATAERSGDSTTVQLIEVFLQPAANQTTAGAFILNTVTYACTAKTQLTTFTAMYASNGAPLKATLTGAAARPVNPGTLDDRAMTVGCSHSVPVGTTPPFTNLTDALVAGWKNLAAAKSAAAKPATPAPAH